MRRHQKGERGSQDEGCFEGLVRIELLTLFHRNPGLVCSCSYLAEATGREIEVVRAQAEKLLGLRILDLVEEGGERRYRYLPPQAFSHFPGGGEEAEAV